MKKKCVCISCFDHYATRMQSIIDFFDNRGYETKYIFADFDHFSKQKNEHEYINGVKIEVPQYKRNLSVQRLFSHFAFSKGVIQFIKKYKPDVIYCLIPPNSLVSELAKYKQKNQEVKLFFDCYDLWPESFPSTKFVKFLKIPFSVWGELRKKYISSADTIIAVSEQMAQVLRLEVKNKLIKIIKPTIKVGDIPKYNSDVSTLTFCYLGMVNHITDKNLGVKLLGELAKYKTVKLHIIGEGQNLATFVENLIAVNVQVICHGCVFDMSEKNRIFSLCNMGLNIPREEINSTMSLKAIEYMRAGLPFINNALGDIREIVEQHKVGINVNKSDIDASVKTILELSKNDMELMHINSMNAYNDCFIKQDFDNILGV